MHKVLYLISLFFVLSITGCANLPYENQFSPYESGIFEGKNIRIEAIDKSFKISEGRFVPPFQTDPMSPIVWTPIYSNKIVSGDNYVSYPTSLLDSFQFALQHGARKVLVHHTASEKPLYGVLLFNKKHLNSTGAAARSYLIRIPDSYVKSAKGGRVSVVYEPVSRSDRPINMYGWVLWLSDIPF